MTIIDLYQSTEHKNNLAHFSAIVNLALADGHVSADEEGTLKKYAYKLGVEDHEYQMILENPKKYPLVPPVSSVKRTERIYDFFRIVYSDHVLEDAELVLIRKYAIGLGYTDEKAEVIIKKSMKIFGGKIPFEDYLTLV